MRIPLGAIILIGLVVVAGCSKRGLRDLQPGGPGPDEFMLLPNQPLTAPKDYQVLPAPTPGGANLVDPHPKADAVVALGGKASALTPGDIPASDGALVTQVSRYGVPANTRVALAETDAKFRKKQSVMTRIRLFPVDRYEQAYRREALNPFDKTNRFRRSGISTPSSRPAIK